MVWAAQLTGQKSKLRGGGAAHRLEEVVGPSAMPGSRHFDVRCLNPRPHCKM